MAKPKPQIHGRDHEHGGADTVQIHWEDVGDSGAGGGIQFDIDNIGGTLRIETTTTLTGLPGGVGIRLITDTGDLYVSSAQDVNMDAVRDVAFFPHRDFVASADRDVALTADRDITLRASSGNIIITGLPTSNPGVTGALWNDGGSLMIS